MRRGGWGESGEVTVHDAADLGKVVVERSRTLPKVSLLYLVLGDVGGATQRRVRGGRTDLCVGHGVLCAGAVALGGEEDPEDAPPSGGGMRRGRGGKRRGRTRTRGPALR